MSQHPGGHRCRAFTRSAPGPDVPFGTDISPLLLRSHRSPMTSLRRIVPAVVLIVCAASAHADTVLIDFDTLGDLDPVTTQYQTSDLVFDNALALVSGAVGGSLNEFDFPPASGDVVVTTAFPGPLLIEFLRPVVRVSGRFTYGSGPLTLTGWSGLTSAVTGTSGASENLGTGSGTPNELIELVFAGGMTSLTVGDANAAFALDDLFVEFGAGTPVPEPGLALMLAVGAAGALRSRRRD